MVIKRPCSSQSYRRRRRYANNNDYVVVIHHNHHRLLHPFATITNTFTTPTDNADDAADDEDFVETDLAPSPKRNKTNKGKDTGTARRGLRPRKEPAPTPPESHTVKETPDDAPRILPAKRKQIFARMRQAGPLPKEIPKQELSSKESGVLVCMVSRTREWINDLKPGASPPPSPLLFMTLALTNIVIHRHYSRGEENALLL